MELPQCICAWFHNKLFVFCDCVSISARQVAGEASGQLGGPALGRLNRDAGGAQLLSSYDVFLEDAFADGADVAALLKAAGAKLLSRAPVTGGNPQGRTVVVLVDDGMPSQPGADPPPPLLVALQSIVGPPVYCS